MSNETIKVTETLLKCRRDAWRNISEITKNPNLSDREKLQQCLEISSVYYSLTGDDSLNPPQVREARNAKIEWLDENLDRIAARRKLKEEDAKRGYAGDLV